MEAKVGIRTESGMGVDIGVDEEKGGGDRLGEEVERSGLPSVLEQTFTADGTAR